jgi:two-component system response regulator ChvI
MADKRQILVIDDDPDIIESIKAILEKNGFVALTATNEADGLKAVGKKPDLILCDMMMERIDSGSKLAQEIKKVDPKVPILLLSSIGSATASNVEIDKLGFKGVLQKPVDPGSLIMIINKTLGLM